MQVQFNTDESIDGHEALGRHAEDVVRKELDRFTGQVTRVEIHLKDVNSEKFGENDKHCLMEARIAGRQPIAVNEQAATLHQAIDGAARKLKRSLDATFGKLADAERSGPRAGATGGSDGE